VADHHGPDTRATVLATIVMARRALGQPYAELLAEAVALSPDADLVAEARSVVDVDVDVDVDDASLTIESPR